MHKEERGCSLDAILFPSSSVIHLYLPVPSSSEFTYSNKGWGGGAFRNSNPDCFMKCWYIHQCVMPLHTTLFHPISCSCSTLLKLLVIHHDDMFLISLIIPHISLSQYICRPLSPFPSFLPSAQRSSPQALYTVHPFQIHSPFFSPSINHNQSNWLIWTQ